MYKGIKVITAIIIIVMIISIFYPRDINQILGGNVNINKYNHLEILDNSSHGGFASLNTENAKDIEALFEHLKRYRFIRTFQNGFEGSQSYLIQISETSNNNKYIFLRTMGSKYIEIKENNEEPKRYRVIKDKLDNEFFKDFYQSLK